MKILVADRDGNRAVALAAQLAEQDGAFAISFVLDREPLLDAVRRSAAELVIVDMARPDRDGLDSVWVLNAAARMPIVMFVDDDDPQFMEDAIASGVISYHVYGAALPAIKPILRTAMALFKRTAALSGALAAAQEQLHTRNTLDAAKRLLMSRDGMSEPAAHRFLQRRAMRQQKKLGEIAATVLRDADEIGAKHE